MYDGNVMLVLQTPNPRSDESHPLAKTKAVTINMEFDEDSDWFVTYARELHGMSTYGASEREALDNTAEMIRGYVKSLDRPA